jgi:hypothetical protein
MGFRILLGSEKVAKGSSLLSARSHKHQTIERSDLLRMSIQLRGHASTR